MRARPRKTYSHLAEARRIPTEYEIVTSRLHYYVGRGFEVALPLKSWYQVYQSECPLAIEDWDVFRDPRETTYTKYTSIQTAKEAHLEGVLRFIEESGYDEKLSPACLALLERALPPLRYVFHALQMLAAYIGQMAPSGRITIASALQAADEMRRVQRITYRMAQLRIFNPELGDNAKNLWEREAAWQPLRRLVENLLVTYDWGEAFAALNLCTKPILDEFFMSELPELAKSEGDYILREIFFSLNEDCIWHREWSGALVGILNESHPENAAVLRRWVEYWLPEVEDAVRPIARFFGGTWSTLHASARANEWLRSIGVGPSCT